MAGNLVEPVVLFFRPSRPLEPCTHASGLRGLLLSAGVRPVVVRVAPGRVEVETLPPMEARAVEVGERLVGPLLGRAAPWGSPEKWLDAFRRFAAEQRFWEAHTAAEAGWRLASAGWARGLAIAAAALAKAQEGLPKAAGALAAKAALYSGGPLRVSPECLAREAWRACRGLEASLLDCISRGGASPGAPG